MVVFSPSKRLANHESGNGSHYIYKNTIYHQISNKAIIIPTCCSKGESVTEFIKTISEEIRSSVGRTTEAKPASFGRHIALQPDIAICMTVSSFALFAFEQSVKVVVAPAHIARFFIGIEIFFLVVFVLHCYQMASFVDKIVNRSAVWAFVRKARGLENALKAERVFAGQFADIFRDFAFEIA